MADRLEIGEARHGMPAGPQPLIHGALSIAGGGQVMDQKLGWRSTTSTNAAPAPLRRDGLKVAPA
jgi:hypothetical protein